MKIYKTSNLYKAYHGANTSIDKFDISFSGKGNDQEGPGIYFTNNISDAGFYGKYVHEVILDLNNVITDGYDYNAKHVEQMILWSVGVNNVNDLYNLSEEQFNESELSNWDQNVVSAFESAVESITTYSEGENVIFQSIWYDFYRYKPVDYLINMVRLG